MDQAKTEALEYIRAEKEKALAASHAIWEYAELSLKEYKSAAYYCDALRKEGFAVEEKLCGIDTAFSGSFGSGRPVIGILAEFDALSGLSQEAALTEKKAVCEGGSGHGCGHNMLGAASFGAALGIKHYLEKTGCSGTVVFYGCPGEEGGASKALMAREKVWADLDAALTWHPGDANEVTTGTCNSCVQAIYRFTGIAAHAGGSPHMGRSALDAAELMNVGVQFLREHMKSDARIHYSFIDCGGISPNVVQPTAGLLYMIRSLKVKEVLELEKRVDKIAEGAAMMTETKVEKTFVDGCSTTVPNHTLEKVLYRNMCEIGAPTYTEEEKAFAEKLRSTYNSEGCLPGDGARFDASVAAQVKLLSDDGKKTLNDYVLPLYAGPAFSPGSTDVGDVSWLTPTAQFNALAWPLGCPGHSWQNVSSGASSIGDKAVLYAAEVLCASAIDLFNAPDTLKAAKEEFEKEAAEGYFSPVPAGAKLYVL